MNNIVPTHQPEASCYKKWNTHEDSHDIMTEHHKEVAKWLRARYVASPYEHDTPLKQKIGIIESQPSYQHLFNGVGNDYLSPWIHENIWTVNQTPMATDPSVVNNLFGMNKLVLLVIIIVIVLVGLKMLKKMNRNIPSLI